MDIFIISDPGTQMPAVSFRVDAEHAQLSEIVRGLYVCGVSSLTARNIEEHDIALIINATHEVTLNFLSPSEHRPPPLVAPTLLLPFHSSCKMSVVKKKI